MAVNRGQNNENVLNTNRFLIVQHLQRQGVCTRAQLSKALGLTPASISKTTAALIDHGLIKETGYLSGEKGRRSVGIALRTNRYRVIGVRLSRRSFSVGVFDFAGRIFDVCTETFEAGDQLTDITARIRKDIQMYLDKFDSVTAIGIAVPGPYLENEGKILLITEMDAWGTINIKKLFRESFQVPVIIKHDANSGALADWWFGTQVKQRGGTLIHFLVGEGVGAGVLVDGTILSGDHGIAGEIGHTSIDVEGERCGCGNYGCLETYCSSLAFVKHAERTARDHPSSVLSRHPSLTAGTIFTAAQQGDELAVSLVRRAGRYIGYGVVSLINTYDPSTIVISNEMAQGGEILMESVREAVRERVLPSIYEKVSIEFSMFSNDPVLYGAAAVAIDFCLKQPDILIQH